MIYAIAGLAFVGCGSPETGAEDGPSGEVVPADSPASVPGMPATDRFWAEVHPMDGRIELYRLYPGNVIHRGERQIAIGYSYAGVATWPGVVGLHTNQAEVSYRDSNDVCHSNRAVVDCATLRQPCNATHVFCAPLELGSNATSPLPDVVVQLSQQNNLGNAIIGCIDDGSTGLCHSDGSCPPGAGGTPSGNAAKVDCRTSLLTSPIPGGNMGTAGCSYCY